MCAIGIFDSGVGGLGIFKAVVQYLPAEDIIYLADNKNSPFGQKTTEELHQITSKILDYLIYVHNIKLAVVACNTASVSSLAYLREKYSIPIVGTVPVVKPACELSKAKKVAILATLHTANSDYQKNLISQFGGGIEVLSIACPDLVDLIEAGLLEDIRIEDRLKTYLAPAIKNGVDVVGLACTHYPFLREQMRRILPAGVEIIDSNDSVARQVFKVNSKIPVDQAEVQKKSGEYSFYVTKQPEKFQAVAQNLIGQMVSDISLISL